PISARRCAALPVRLRKSQTLRRKKKMKRDLRPSPLRPLAATVHQRQRNPGQRKKGRAPMFELMFCSLLTIVPDYLFRRYVQGKRFGKEITFFSVWYELRWGITGCLMLTVSLITMIFYFHPSTTSAALYFRTVPILPDGSGRVAEVNV